MRLGDRDRKALLGGGALVVLVLLMGYVILPGLRKWSDTRATAADRVERLNDLRERVDKHEALVKQRNSLVLRLGALFDPVPVPAKANNAGTQEAVAPQTEPPPVPEAEKTAAPSPIPSEADKKPESSAEGDSKRKSGEPATEGASLAGYLEKNAQKSGVTIKSITPGKPLGGMRGLKAFRAVMLQVKCEGNIQSLVTLLHALEKGERFVKVEQMQINRDASKDTFSVTLDVRAYEATARPS